MNTLVPNDLELFALGQPFRNLAEGLQTGLFQGATIDLFLQEKHLRISDVHMIVGGPRVRPDPHHPHKEIKQFRGGAWKRARSQLVDLRINLDAIPVAFHDEHHKLMFVTLKHTTLDGYTVQFVMYRAGWDLSPGNLQVVDWPIGLQPMLGRGEVNTNRKV